MIARRSITRALHKSSLSNQGPSKGNQSWSGVQNGEEYLLKLQAARSSLQTEEAQQQGRQKRSTGAADPGAVRIRLFPSAAALVYPIDPVQGT